MADDPTEELHEMWKALHHRRNKGLRIGRLSLKVTTGHLACGVDHLGGIHLLVPVPDSTDQRNLWRASAVSLHRANHVGEDLGRRTWLDLKCRIPALENVFTRVACSLVEGIAKVVDPQRIEHEAVKALDSWQELLGSSRNSEESVIGLIGELLILEQLAAKDPAAALASWEGPRGGRHDFRSGSQAIEAKATLQRAGYFTEIHGCEQLLEPAGGNLTLAFTRLERVPGGPLSVLGMMARLASTGMDEAGLIDAIDEGDACDLGHASARSTFELNEQAWFQVTPDFPRIIPAIMPMARLPHGVVDISYRIDLLGQPRLSESEATTARDRFMQGNP